MNPHFIIQTKFVLFLLLSKSYLFSQSNLDSLTENLFSYQEKYQFDKIKDDGTCIINIIDVKGDIKINGHMGSGVMLIANHFFDWDLLKENTQSKEKNILNVFHNDQRIDIKSMKNINHKYSSNYILNIPINTNLYISLSGGNVNANQINGNIKIFSSGGDISLDKIFGNVEINTYAGSIIIQNCTGDFRANTNNGNIRINKNKANFFISSSSGDTFINELIGNLELMNKLGSVYLNNLKNGNIQCHLSYGNIIAKEIKGDFYGQIKNGDISIESLYGLCNITSTNGDIITDYLNGPVIIDVEKGNISGTNIYGPIQAFTSFGNISFDIAFNYSRRDDSISLETVAGNIDISIPKNLPINIKAEVSNYKNLNTISSDIPIEFINNNETYASGKVLGGTIPIHLFSGDGHIIIREN